MDKKKINWRVTPEEIMTSIRETSGGMKVYSNWLESQKEKNHEKHKKVKTKSLKGGLE